MLKIIMLQNQNAAPDGIDVRSYKEGSVYSVPRDMTEALAQIFLQEKWAQEVTKNSKVVKRRSRKSLASAPENKSI